jgi:hypothetical protein
MHPRHRRRMSEMGGRSGTALPPPPGADPHQTRSDSHPMTATRRLQLAAVALLAAAAAPAHAQIGAPARPSLSIAGGISQFDLSGTGTAPVVTARVDYPLGRVLLAEGGVAVARPDQQFGSRTTLVVPEVGLQLQYPARVAPYLGVGVGSALDFRRERDGGTVGDPTVSGAAGVRAWVTDRLGLRGELRVRGIGRNFAGSTAEWTVGAALRF